MAQSLTKLVETMEAGSSMDAYHASIMVGATRFVMSAVCTFLLSRCGRRRLCMISSLGMAVFMGISGYYTRGFLQRGEASIVPVICILLYVCFCMIGLLSLPWTMAAELFPTEIRGYGHAMVIGAAHLVMFTCVQTYYTMVETFGGHDVLQWFFAAMSLLALVFSYFLVPETFNKTLFEIEDYFKTSFVYPKRKKSKVPDVEQNVRKPSIVRTRLESVAEETPDLNGLTLSTSIPFIDASVTNLNKH